MDQNWPDLIVLTVRLSADLRLQMLHNQLLIGMLSW